MVDHFALAVAELEEAWRASDRGNGFEDQSITSVGGHTLRRRDESGRTIVRKPSRPWSVLSPSRGLAADTALETTLGAIAQQTAENEDSDEASEVGDQGGNDTFEGDDDEDELQIQDGPPAQQQPPPPPAGAAPPPPPLPPPPLPMPPTEQSALAAASTTQATRPGHSILNDLQWQKDVDGEAAKAKAFRGEVLQRLDLVVFAYMRPGSSAIQLLHSAATFSMHGADAELRGKDFAFIGDRKGPRHPVPVLLNPDLPWKWLNKKIVLDSAPYEEFYAVPANARKLWQPTDRTGAQDVSLPRMLALAPPFVAFCTDAQRTPFELHRFVANYAAAEDDVGIMDACRLTMDWCLLAGHPDATATATSSVLAITLQAAPVDDDLLLEWL